MARRQAEHAARHAAIRQVQSEEEAALRLAEQTARQAALRQAEA